jgi:hypothetical protein
MKISCSGLTRIYYYELGFHLGCQPRDENVNIYGQPKVILYLQISFIFFEYYLEIHIGSSK